MLIPWIYFLQNDEELLIESFTKKWTVKGPRIYFALPFLKISRIKGIILGPTQYMRIRNNLTGELKNEKGPKLYFLNEYEEIIQKLNAIVVKNNQYVKIIDNNTGQIRVERGERLVYLTPTEQLIYYKGKDVNEGVNIDEKTAILIRDTNNGKLELITEKQVFFPSSNQEIIEIRKLIRLEDHETVIIKDKEGKYIFKTGKDKDRSFFLEPYSRLVKLYWSAGLYKSERNLEISYIDSRPKYMWFELEARTKDNVELIIGITFFLQIVNVKQMVQTTDDTPRDICSHARSSIIQSVSVVSLEEFLANFNSIVHESVLKLDDKFYSDRGVKIHAVEVRSVSCKDSNTQMILQEIIRETTNRLNSLQKQESDNEVKLKKIAGEIEAEKLNEKLIQIQHEHKIKQGLIEGEAQAVKVKSFFDGLGDEVSYENKIAIFNTLRKNEAFQTLSKGKTQMYFTPSDVNLSIETSK